MTQPDLFRPMCGQSFARQGELFAAHDHTATRRRCAACGEHLTRTPSGFLACPRGHGRLIEDQPGAPPGSLFG